MKELLEYFDKHWFYGICVIGGVITILRWWTQSILGTDAMNENLETIGAELKRLNDFLEKMGDSRVR